MKWPWEKETEHRAGLTDLLVQHITDTASGGTAVPDSLAAVEIASGLWGRAFSSAKVEGEGMSPRAVTPAVLEMIGRGLIRRGEAVFEIVVTGGGLTLRPCADWSVSGGPDPDSWIYLLNIPGPSTTISKTVAAQRVVHVRYAADQMQPWQGRSPIAVASATTKTAANLELRLGQELSSQVGTLLPVPGDPSDDNKYATLKTQLGALKGKTALVPSQSKDWASDQGGQTAGSEWKPRRFGADPPEQMDIIRNSTAMQILAACGVPVSLLQRADGTALRESWRQFLVAAINPVSELVKSELSNKLDSKINLDFTALRASDISGRARAFGVLVGNGVSIADAMVTSGLKDE